MKMREQILHLNILCLASNNSTAQKNQYRQHFQRKVVTEIEFATSKRYRTNKNNVQCVHPENE